jgi:hypothetical protein
MSSCFTIIGRHFSMANRRDGDNEARADELGNDPAQVGPDSAGKGGEAQGLSDVPDASEESVMELAETDQALEAEAVAGVEDAADRPEKPVRTHLDRPRADDIPPKDGSKEAA